VALHDAEVAFFHALLDEWICIKRPPPGTVAPGHGWQLLRALYGTRRASQLWAEFVAGVYDKGGWVRSRVVPNCFFKLQPPMTSVVHGDDFATEGPDEQQDELDALLMDNVRIKMLGRVGPGYSRQGRFLKRYIEWRGDRYVYYSNPKHAETVVNMMGVGSGNGIDTPGSKATGATPADASEPLAGELSREIASAIGNVLYISLDRPDLQHSARELATDLSAPTRLTELRTKRVARFLQRRPNVEWRFPVKDEEPGAVTGYSDSDWAADRATRRSTSGVSLMHNGHLIDMISAGQGTVALSSAEAEFYALGRMAASALMIANLLD